MATENIPPTKTISKRRSFYVSDDLWFKFQSKLWSDRTNASKWIREMMEWYINDEDD